MTNNQPSTEGVRLAIDGVIALDIDLPAATRCRSEEPVFSYVYDLEPGRVDLTLDLQGEKSSSAVDIPSSGTVWAVVDIQSKRERGDVSIYDAQPSWG